MAGSGRAHLGAGADLRSRAVGAGQIFEGCLWVYFWHLGEFGVDLGIERSCSRLRFDVS